MLVPAVMFWEIVLAVHIIAVVATFGVVFAYPLFAFVGTRLDPRAIPWFHRMQAVIGRRLISPGLAVILVAGIYLASKLDQWHQFYVQWGLAMVVVLGALEGAYMTRHEEKLAALAERDLSAVPAGADAAARGAFTWSPEYQALFKRVGAVGALMVLLVIVTIYLMTVQAG